MFISTWLVRIHLWYAGHGPRWPAFVLARLHPDIHSLSQVEDCWKLENKYGSFYCSDPRQITRFAGIGINMRDRVFQKYTLPGFVEVEAGDTIIEVGAFIGEFARQAGEIGGQVIAVEPDERNAAALRRNLEHLPDSEVVQKAAWKETGTRSFQVASDPSEGSILSVDTDDVTEVITLDTISVDDLAANLSLNNIDYLKIEAEGAEPEVLEGANMTDIQKIAVECAPERDGESPIEGVTNWLKSRNYTVQKQNNIVFARQ